MFSLLSNVLLCEAQQPCPLRGHQEKNMNGNRLHRSKGKPGRPKGAPEDIRRKTIGVRVNEAEWQNLESKAKEMGMSPAQWLRVAALSRRLPAPPVPAANRESYAELARLAGNINQLARAAHERRAMVDTALLREVLRQVQSLQTALLGINTR